MTHNYTLGFKIGSYALPDPQEFGYQVSDLDTSAERDTTGLLHRKRVATKRNVQLKYNVIDWATAKTILAALGSASFQFTYPDPEAGGLRTGKYYVGNRQCDAVWLPAEQQTQWYASLTFNVIEY